MAETLTRSDLLRHFNDYDELKLCVHWKEVGLDLGLKEMEINVIAADHKYDGVQKCSFKMFDRWRSDSENPTLDKLLKAIKAVNDRHERDEKRKKLLKEGKKAEKSVKVLERLVDDWEKRNKELKLDLRSQVVDLNAEEKWFQKLQQRNDEWQHGEISFATRRAKLVNDIDRSYRNSPFIQEYLRSNGCPTLDITNKNVAESILRHVLMKLDIKRSGEIMLRFKELKKHVIQLERLQAEIGDFECLLENRLNVYGRVVNGLSELGVSSDNIIEKLDNQSQNMKLFEEQCSSASSGKVDKCKEMCGKAKKDLDSLEISLTNFIELFEQNATAMKQLEEDFEKNLISFFPRLIGNVLAIIFDRNQYLDPEVGRKIIHNYRLTMKKGMQTIEQLRSIRPVPIYNILTN